MTTIKNSTIKGMLRLACNDKARPILGTLALQEGYLYVTDGYALVRLRAYDVVDGTIHDSFDDNLVLDPNKIKDWCSSHKPKDTISLDELRSMATTSLGEYPNLGYILKPIKNYTHEQKLLNPDLVSGVLKVLSGHSSRPVDITTGDEKDGRVFFTNEFGDEAVVMAMVGHFKRRDPYELPNWARSNK